MCVAAPTGHVFTASEWLDYAKAWSATPPPVPRCNGPHRARVHSLGVVGRCKGLVSWLPQGTCSQPQSGWTMPRPGVTAPTGHVFTASEWLDYAKAWSATPPPMPRCKGPHRARIHSLGVVGRCKGLVSWLPQGTCSQPRSGWTMQRPGVTAPTGHVFTASEWLDYAKAWSATPPAHAQVSWLPQGTCSQPRSGWTMQRPGVMAPTGHVFTASEWLDYAKAWCNSSHRHVFTASEWLDYAKAWCNGSHRARVHSLEWLDDAKAWCNGSHRARVHSLGVVGLCKGLETNIDVVVVHQRTLFSVMWTAAYSGSQMTRGLQMARPWELGDEK
eukprot:gene10186-8095_t